MQIWSDYPVIRLGDTIMWAPEPKSPIHLWSMGRVICVKNQSCDAIVFMANGTTATKHDIWYATDPNCDLTPNHYREVGRGVFKLAPCEIEYRELRDKVVPALRREIAALKNRFEEVLSSGDESKLMRRVRQSV